MIKRRNFSDQFKAAVALEALRGNKTVQEIAAKRLFGALTERKGIFQTLDAWKLPTRVAIINFRLGFLDAFRQICVSAL